MKDLAPLEKMEERNPDGYRQVHGCPRGNDWLCLKVFRHRVTLKFQLSGRLLRVTVCAASAEVRPRYPGLMLLFVSGN